MQDVDLASVFRGKRDIRKTKDKLFFIGGLVQVFADKCIFASFVREALSTSSPKVRNDWKLQDFENHARVINI